METQNLYGAAFKGAQSIEQADVIREAYCGMLAASKNGMKDFWYYAGVMHLATAYHYFDTSDPAMSDRVILDVGRQLVERLDTLERLL